MRKKFFLWIFKKNMIDNVTFTGIKNIGTVRFNRQNHTARSITMQLTDDFNGKDLEEFKTICSKIQYSSTGYRNPFSPDILNIECLSRNYDKSDIFINGRVLNINDINLPMFSYIAKLTGRIAKMPNDKMVVNSDFKEFVANEVLISDEKISNLVQAEQPVEFYNQFFDGKAVRKAATEVNNFIQNLMNHYFEI